MATFPTTLNLPMADKPLMIRNSKELRNVAAQEVDGWEWASGFPFADWVTNQGGRTRNGLRGRFQDKWRALKAAVSIGSDDQILPSLQEFLGPAGTPSVQSADGKLVLEIAKLSPEFGVGALHAATNVNRDPALQLYEPGVVMFWAKKAKSLRGSVPSESLTELRDQSVEAIKFSIKTLNSARQRQRKGAVRYLRLMRRFRSALLRKAAEQQAAAINSIRAVENSYLQQMTLQAPVTYWAKRSREHSDRFKRLSWAAGAYALGASLLLGVGGLTFVRLEIGKVIQGDIPYQLVFVELSVILMIATVVFWVGRVLSKIMLSERHLATDAAERAVMAETYLALLHDGAVTDGERPLVLNALFRASTDGIVKDDGGGDVNVAALLARALTPSSGR